jgi:hypothetical protein
MNLQRAAVKFHLVGQVDLKQRLANADECQFRHRRDQIELAAVFPIVQEPLRMFDGRLGIALEHARLKGRLKQAALPQPLVAFADKHAAARKAPDGAAVALEFRE